VDHLEAAVAQPVDFVCGFAAAIDGVVDRDLASLPDSTKGVRCSHLRIIASMDRQITSVVERVPCAVGCIDDDDFACTIDGPDRAINSTCNILSRKSGWRAQQ
jgi:hypothetical protein